ncbi:MAG TPA: DinB family protein [Thermoanaerobaculia bacterium]|nr:DinB family protein [Thermoanaerobaculia bacterium]
MPHVEKTRPDASQAVPYYFTYIDKVPPGDIRNTLEKQGKGTRKLLEGISEKKSRHRYAADKWTIRQVLGHINDCERLFVFRAFWFARGFDLPLPSFEQEVAVSAAGSDEIPWARHVEEFAAIRKATNIFFRNLPDAAWSRRGIASGNPFTVRALAWIAAGHAAHHIGIVKERYL